MAKRTKPVGAIAYKHGTAFRVWAPFADKVQLRYGTSIDWRVVDMAKDNDGYWWVHEPQAQPGQEYQFIIVRQGKTYVRNDPRALQLTSTGGTSVIVDKHFDWGDDNFKLPPKNKLVIYELHVGSFHRPDASTEGTFYNVIEKLDYLADIGINLIELMPIGSMLNDHGWGYAPEFIYAVEAAYGGRHALLELVKAAHAKGIGVALDVVYNHLGPDEDLDLWRFDGWYENDGGGIYFYNDWRGKTPWADTRPDFGREEVRRFLLDNARYWLLDCRLDGLRVDSTLYTRNVYGRHNDPPTDLAEGWSFLQKINALGHKINPEALIIAEDIAANDYLTKPASSGGCGFDAQWQVTMPHAFRQALLATSTDQIDLSGLITELGRSYNQDVWQQVVYSDSHDSAANGEARLNYQIDPNRALARTTLAKYLLAAGVVFTAPGIPMLLMGQEFAQGGSFSDWHELDWQQAETHAGIVLAHKHLIALRLDQHGHTRGLSGQGINLYHLDEDNKVMAYHRWDKGGPGDDVVVVLNFSAKSFDRYDLGFPRTGDWKIRFNSTWSGYHPQFKPVDVTDIKVASGQGTLKLPAHAVLILSQDA